MIDQILNSCLPLCMKQRAVYIFQNLYILIAPRPFSSQYDMELNPWRPHMVEIADRNLLLQGFYVIVHTIHSTELQTVQLRQM